MFLPYLMLALTNPVYLLLTGKFKRAGTLMNIQARRNEKNSGGATNYEILLATMVGRRKKFCISNRLKRVKKLNICSR